MAIPQLIARVELIENTISSIFKDQFRGMEDDSITFAVAPLRETDSHNIHAWLEIVQSDLENEVLQATAHVVAGQGGPASRFVSLITPVASRLRAAATAVRHAIETWEQICKARQAVCLVPGGLNREELWRYRAHAERSNDALLRQITTAKVCLQEIHATIEDAKASVEYLRRLDIRCPITGQSCDKPVVASHDEVFVGLQFQSNHYKTSSLKLMVTEALDRFDLTSFFPDEHYEPVHISCEICHALQRVSVCLFEISDLNPNVMLELGLAYMLGKPVILLAKKESPGTHMADIAGIHRIEYDDLVECRDLIGRCLEDSATLQALLPKTRKDGTG